MTNEQPAAAAPTTPANLGASTPKRHSDLCRDYMGPHVVDGDCLFEPLDVADATRGCDP